MAGNQSRGLIAASKTRGWDPTVIPAGYGKPAESIAPFDKDMGNLPDFTMGRLPGGNPDGWQDGVDSEHGQQPPQGVRLFEKPPFNTPDYGRETAARGYGPPLAVNQPTYGDSRGAAATPLAGEQTGSMFDTPFSIPKVDRENVSRRTTKANPFPDMGI